MCAYLDAGSAHVSVQGTGAVGDADEELPSEILDGVKKRHGQTQARCSLVVNTSSQRSARGCSALKRDLDSPRTADVELR